MGAFFEYDIPIKPHLKRFLSKELGLDFYNGEKWLMGHNSIYGKYAMMLLGSSHKDRLNRKPIDSAEKIRVRISSKYHFGIMLDNAEDERIWANFNVYLNDMFNYVFFTYVDCSILKNAKTQRLASELLLEFSLADDLETQGRMSKIFAKVMTSKTRKDSIYDFMELYSIDEDEISYECLVRRHKRYLEKKGKKLAFEPEKFRPLSSYDVMIQKRYANKP